MTSVLAATLPFFAIILCGWLARARGVMGENSPKPLNDFVLNFALPALLVERLSALPIADLLVPSFIAGWAAVSVLMFAAVALSARLLGQPAKGAVMFGFAAAHGNVGYLGVTLVVAVGGAAVAAPVAMAIIVDMLLIVPLVIALSEFLGRREGSPLAAGARALRAAVANPFVLSIILGLALSGLGLRPSGLVLGFLQTLGAAAVPAALFAIGVTLYGQPLRALGPELAVVAGLKLLVHPVLMIFVMADVFGVPPALVGPAALLAALPVANNVFVLATRYDARPGAVSAIILATTAASLVTFNLWAALILDPG